MTLRNILLFVIALYVGRVLYYKFDSNFFNSIENFYNIIPTELIDPEYYNINQDPFDYKKNLRVGDLRGVDLNCNNITIDDLVEWIRRNNPHLLHQYVYLYDPSINIYNPRFTPRVFKALLRNLPQKHPILRIVRKCFPRRVSIS